MATRIACPEAAVRKISTMALRWARNFDICQRPLASESLAASQRKEPMVSARFYEDSFVKPLLIAASMGGTSWAPHEGR